MNKRYKDYVCPVCFRRLTQCTCKSTPWELIQIDAKIQDAVRILNTEGYYTRYSCEGHYNGKNNVTEGYILFSIPPNDCPQGWRKNKSKIYYNYEPKSKEDFDAYQKEKIAALNKWAKEKEGV